MEALPIFLDAIVPAAWAIMISVTAVLFFGEIIPQAVCTGPQQLKIASMVAPSVNFLMIAVGIVAYPISKILDCLLGEHHAIRYNNNDLKALIELHSLAALQETLDDPNVRGFGLQAYQTKMIQGAIDIQSHKVKDIMIPFERVYSVRIGKRIDLKSAKKILKYGYSRIPVYMNKDKHAIIGYLLIKTLVGVDLTEGKTINELISESVVTLRKPLYISPNEDIGGLLTRFKIGKSHMAIVTDNIKLMEQNMRRYLDDDGSVIDADEDDNIPEKKPKVLGIITLEDVIESALKEDIMDEADYDIENDPNLQFRLEKSFDAVSQVEPPKAGSQLHQVIQNKVREKLGRKQSEIPVGAVTLSKQWFEMHDMKEGLLDKSNGYVNEQSKAGMLQRQMKDPEMSKSYSFMNRNKNIN